VSRRPKADTDFAQAVLDAFRKRSKAISRLAARPECTPVKEVINGRESQLGRTDIEIRYQLRGAWVDLRFHVWGDRWVWVDARSSSKSGWVWEFTIEGRFISPGGARDLVARAEETISASYKSTDDIPQAMSAIWATCLATGPQRV